MNDTHKQVCDDRSFGPVVSSTACRGGFDFTVTFEEAILSILPSAMFIIAVLIQLTRTFKKRSLTVQPSLLYPAKLSAIIVYAGLQLALVVLWASESAHTAPISIASSALGLCSAIGLAIISPLEHRSSPRPSFIIVSYLLISLLFDTARVRTAWLLGGIDSVAVAATATASILAKLCILILEAVNKRHILVDTYRSLSYEATSGIIGRGMFWWLASLLRNGYSHVLKPSDLFSIHEKFESRKLTKDLSIAWKKDTRQQSHSLATATLHAWRFDALKILFPRFAVVGLSLLQPFIIQKVTDNLLAPVTEQTRNNGYGLIGAVALAYSGIAIGTGFYQHLSFRLMTMIRGGLMGLIYQKLAKSPTAGLDASDSAVMTLVGTDVEKISETWYLIVESFLPCAIQSAIAVWLLERQLGAVCVAPILLALTSTAASFKAATFVRARQKIWLEAIQARVNFTAHIIGNMKSVKMLGLTDKLQGIIQSMRAEELELSKKYRRLSSFNICLSNLPENVGNLLTFAAFAIVAKVQNSDSFTLSQAISSLSILAVLMGPLAQLIYNVPQIYSAIGCFERVQAFLNSDSWRDSRVYSIDQVARCSEPDSEDAASSAVGNSPPPEKSACVSENIVVHDATFGWNDSAPVVRDVCLRAGPESLLTIILGPIGCGKSTLLKGILGETLLLSGNVWTSSKDISFCDQTPWMSMGTVRDSIVGPAKFEPDWYETVVHASALDVDFQQLQDGDQSNVGSQGVSLSGGQRQRIAIARALYSRKPIAIFDDVVSGLDAVTKEIIMTRVFGREGLLRKMGTVTLLATHFTDKLNVADQVILLDAEGHIAKQGPPEALSEDVVSVLNSDGQPHTSPDEKHEYQLNSTSANDKDTDSPGDRQVGDMAVYKYYFSSLGWRRFAIFATCVISEGAFDTVQYAWLKLWSESTSGSRTGYWIGLYALWSCIRAAGLIIAVYYIYVIIVPRSAKNLHYAVLKAAFRAPMSFHSKTATGVLVNRFSQDMQLVDMILPGSLVNTSFQIMGCLSGAVLTIVATPYLAAVMPVLGAILYILQRFYLRTSRQLRLLELESKAPLFSHIIDTINGMVSIRAYGWVDSHTDKTFQLLQNCQKPFYLLLCIQRWLSVILGLVVAALATLLTGLAVSLRGSNISAGFAGIALVNMMNLSESLSRLIVSWTALETSLGAVSRVKTFAEDTPREENAEVEPPANWPTRGVLVFENWTAAYSETPVLHGVSFSIRSGEKVAICGRTGSGKSSLITSVLGMVPGTDGQIILDDVDLATISKDAIRKKITCITQDPFLFGGSIRLNMDSEGDTSDEAIQAALQRVGLWAAIQRATEKNAVAPGQILDVEVGELHLSHGQSQLFCLARALLRNSPVVLLDEPTSSVDLATEMQIHEIVEKEFQNSTVIMITHRLSAIHSFDKVAVLDRGALVEFGPPATLLADKSGSLSKLYETVKDAKQD